MELFRRYLTVLVFAMWMGGFTFYAEIVIPTAAHVLGSERQVGFITRQVTHWLNLIGLAALAVFAWSALSERIRQPAHRRRWLYAALAIMALAQVGLFVTHATIDRQLDPQALKIHDFDHFEILHDTYLAFATAQWVAALVYIWQSLAAWRHADAAVSSLEKSRSAADNGIPKREIGQISK